MEIVLGLLLVIAVPIVVLGAKRGAEAAQREREARWARAPASPARTPRGGGAGPGSGVDAGPRSPGDAGLRSPARAPEPRSPIRGISALRATRTAERDMAGLWSRLTDRARSPSLPAPRDRERRVAVAPAAESTAAPPIDLNSASLDELRNLPGVGVRAAQRIAAHRDRHGPFASVAELAAVEGFDQHRISRLAARAKV